MRALTRLACLVLTSAGLAGTAVAEPSARLPRMYPDAVSELRLEVAGVPVPAKAEDRADRAAIAAFYGCHAAAPLWTAQGRPSPRAGAALAELRKAADWGLDTEDLALGSLEEDMAAGRLAAVEHRLSLAALGYARQARGGRIPDPPSQLASYIDRKPALLEPDKVLADLAAAAAPDAFLRGLHPKHAEFESLRQELVRQNASSQGFAERRLPPGPTLRPGMTHPHVAILRTRLGAPLPQTDDGSAPDAGFYDDGLAEKVKQFQREAGLDRGSGTVGPKTRAELNEGVAAAADTRRRILANMEAWRWMPENLGGFHIWVNIPEFMVRVIKDGRIVHEERVVTGKTNTQTPIFSDLMRTVVFQPQWGLPDSIKVNEILPRLQRGEGLRSDLKMQRNGREVNAWSVDWSRADIREYHVYQPSGDDNALGIVKFLFPNKHQVYMHDTPSKGLFKESQRTYSHGCVRVRNPVRLAEVVLGEDKGWSAQQVRSLVEDGPENNKISLDARVPVHITYFTARAGGDGSVQYVRDIYGHENRIALALEGKWSQIPKLPDHLAPVALPPPVARARPRYDDGNSWAWNGGYAGPGVAYNSPYERRGGRNYVVAPPPAKFQNRYGLTRSQPSFFQKLFGAN